MKRRSFLALLGSLAAAVAVENKLGAMALPRLDGGDYDHASALWTPDVPLPVLPPSVDVKTLLSAQRVLRELTIKLDRRLPRNGRQVIVPHPGQNFWIGDTVLAADLTPNTAVNSLLVLPVKGVTLDQLVGVNGGLSMDELGRCGSDVAAMEIVDHWLDEVAEPPCVSDRSLRDQHLCAIVAEHVPAGTEGARILDQGAHLAVRSWRYYDEAARTHEFRFDVLGARV